MYPHHIRTRLAIRRADIESIAFRLGVFVFIRWSINLEELSPTVRFTTCLMAQKINFLLLDHRCLHG